MSESKNAGLPPRTCIRQTANFNALISPHWTYGVTANADGERTSMLNDPLRLAAARSLVPERDQRIEIDLTELGSVVAVAGVICLDQGRLIQVDDLRRMSDLAYTEIQNRSYAKGFQFTQEQMDQGHRRHFEELKLPLLDQGYIIFEGLLPEERASCEAAAVGEK